MNDLTKCELDYLKQATNVLVSVYEVDEETLVDPEAPYDEYLAAMAIDGRELVSFTSESPIDAVDMLSVWAVKHLVISCGTHHQKLELPEPALA